VRALNKCVIALAISVALSDLFENSEDHTDKAADNVDLLHDALDERVLLSELQLVLLQGVVEGHDICIQSKHV